MARCEEIKVFLVLRPRQRPVAIWIELIKPRRGASLRFVSQGVET
jgi:hypothetical protein